MSTYVLSNLMCRSIVEVCMLRLCCTNMFNYSLFWHFQSQFQTLNSLKYLHQKCSELEKLLKNTSTKVFSLLDINVRHMLDTLTFHIENLWIAAPRRISQIVVLISINRRLLSQSQTTVSSTWSLHKHQNIKKARDRVWEVLD